MKSSRSVRPVAARNAACTCPAGSAACSSGRPWPAATKPPDGTRPGPGQGQSPRRRRRSSSPAGSAGRSSRCRPRTLAFKLPGTVQSLYRPPGLDRDVQVGDTLAKGTVIAELDEGDLRRAKASAEARVAQLEARVATAKDNLEIATRNLERFDNAAGFRLRGRARRRGREARRRGRRAGSRRSTRWRTPGCSSTRRTTTTSTASSSSRSTTRPSPRSTSSPASARPPTRSRSA